MKTFIKELILTNTSNNDDEFAGYELKFAVAVGLVFLVAAVIV